MCVCVSTISCMLSTIYKRDSLSFPVPSPGKCGGMPLRMRKKMRMTIAMSIALGSV